jgi:hypothetical protein
MQEIKDILGIVWLRIRSNASAIEKILMVIATCLAALASWNSYVATDEASRIARAAFDFSLQTAQDASELQRPTLTILGGKISEGETEFNSFGEARTVHYRVELHVRNSGTRDASPAWIGLATDRLASLGSAIDVSNIPKDQEITLYLELEGSPKDLENLQHVAVASRFVDTYPLYTSESNDQHELWNQKPKGFTKRCGEPKVQVLTIHRANSDGGKVEALLAIGPSVQTSEVIDKKSWSSELDVVRRAWEAALGASRQFRPC